MSNIHGISEFAGGPPRNEARETSDSEPLDWLFTAPASKGSVRTHSFWQMQQGVLCPRLTACSFTAFLILVLVAMFATQLGVDGINGGGALLEARAGPITSALSVVKGGAVYRPAMAWAVHRDLPSLLGSVVLAAVWVSGMEQGFGKLVCTVIFLLGSFVGFLVGSVDLQSGGRISGAAPGCFALLGASLGLLVLNWREVSQTRGGQAAFYFWMVLLVVLFSLMFNSSRALVLSQLGGLFGGVGLGMAVGKIGTRSSPFPKALIVRIVGILLFAVVLIVPLLMVLNR